ncbi:MAG: HEAT repeat domain-containing protein [Candidatus Omnitrophota bacterium]|nr:HEAT repeat domain-containing protein [Candidatus Omnitrophota bacterium]
MNKLICVVAFLVFACGPVLAQPGIPMESIPPDPAPETRELIKQLYSKNFEDRMVAAGALGKKKAGAAVPYLIDLLCDRNGYTGSRIILVSDAAVKALVNIGEPAIEPLIKEIEFEQNDVPLTENGAVLFYPPGECLSFAEAGEILGLSDSPAVFELLEKALKNPKVSMRLMAAAALGGICDPRAIDLLIGALGDEIPAMRMQAMTALSQYAHSKAYGALLNHEKKETDPRAQGWLKIKLRPGPPPPDADENSMCLDREERLKLQDEQSTIEFWD